MAAAPTRSVDLITTDPYISLGRLGHGVYGYVDRVAKKDGPQTVYARKTVKITGDSGPLRKETLNNEARILRRLRHRHIIRILELYTHRNELSIIMLDVAEMNMAEYFQEVESLTDFEQRSSMTNTMQAWPVCLIQAVDYLHGMRVKHKDLKPDNVLIKDGSVILADFGISKDMIDDETTATKSLQPQGTPMYWAPEVATTGRKGRATDIFSLGCIFLEIGTVFGTPPGTLAQFYNFRETNDTRAYSCCRMKLVKWIWYLWGFWYTHFKNSHNYAFRDYVSGVLELAFLMLDPNPKTRITSRQLVVMVHCKELYYHVRIKPLACVGCRDGSILTGSSIQLHSVYKGYEKLTYPSPPELALSSESIPRTWEEVKRLWLKSHMWWDDQVED